MREPDDIVGFSMKILYLRNSENWDLSRRITLTVIDFILEVPFSVNTYFQDIKIQVYNIRDQSDHNTTNYILLC